MTRATIDGKIIQRFRTPITVIRRAAGSYVNGRYVPAASSTTFTIRNASVQPISEEQLMLLPEGFRTREPVTIFSEAELHTADLPLGREADLVRHGGKLYEIHQSRNWDENGRHWQCLAVKFGQG